jgi:hypothetical protein
LHPAILAAFALLNPDYGCPHVAQYCGAKRRRNETAEIQNADALQNLIH